MTTPNPDALRALQDELDKLDARLNDPQEPDAFAAKLRPRGGDELVPVEDEVEIDPADVGDAWNAAMPRYKGLLDTGEV